MKKKIKEDVFTNEDWDFLLERAKEKSYSYFTQETKPEGSFTKTEFLTAYNNRNGTKLNLKQIERILNDLMEDGLVERLGLILIDSKQYALFKRIK